MRLRVPNGDRSKISVTIAESRAISVSKDVAITLDDIFVESRRTSGGIKLRVPNADGSKTWISVSIAESRANSVSKDAAIALDDTFWRCDKRSCFVDTGSRMLRTVGKIKKKKKNKRKAIYNDFGTRHWCRLLEIVVNGILMCSFHCVLVF